MQRPSVTARGESSSRREPRRLTLKAVAGGWVTARIHNIGDTSGLTFDVPRAALDRIVGPGAVAVEELPVPGATATAHLSARGDGHAYLWVYTPGDDGWDIVVMQSQLGQRLGDLIRL